MDPGTSERPAPLGPGALPVSTPSRTEQSIEDIESAYQIAAVAQIADAQRQLLEVSEWATTLRDDAEHLAKEVARMESSRSWRLTAPFRRAAHAWRGRSTILAWPVVMRFRRILRTLPLPRRPVVILKRVVLHRVFGVAPRRSAPGTVASAGRRRAAGPRVALHALPRLAVTQLPDVFIWGRVDWHLGVQRPQHLARELAAVGHRVFFISPQFVARTEVGFEVEQLAGVGVLFVVRLHAQAARPIHTQAAGTAAQSQIIAGLGQVLEWTGGSRTVNLVHHPFWLPFAEAMPNQVLVCDCPAPETTFEIQSQDLVALKSLLLHRADLVVVTSSWLERITRQANQRVALVRNAGDHQHFSEAPAEIYGDPNGRRVIGYYGTISECFDIDLVRTVAKSLPDVLVLLIGEDTVGARRQLAELDNVAVVGDVSYPTLPSYLHAFDACIVPLRIAPSAIGAIPVQVYDYLSAGKPVVTVDLPEMDQFVDMVRRAGSAECFVLAIRECLAEPGGSEMAKARKRFAAENTWTERTEALRQQIDSIPRPLISVIVVTYNNLELTKQCLASLDALTLYPNYQVVVIDNASSDGTQAFLEQWAEGRSNCDVILNPENRGFSAANNQGLAAAAGEYLVLLNNDTVATSGWLGTLIAHLRRDPGIGLISAVTNNIDNDARIDIGYADLDGMREEALLWTSSHLGQTRSIPSAAFFCVAMSREVHREVGPLDEGFGIGMFEDDDYCRRVEQTGRSIVAALDVFIHHQGAASFDAMDQARRWDLFERNRHIYEAKWGPWPRHVQLQSRTEKGAARCGSRD